MKFALLVLGLLAIVNVAYADGPAWISAPGPVNLPTVRDAFYCQQPSTSWNAGNASTGFQSELADDIPNDYVGQTVNAVTMYVAQWGGNWQNPTSFVLNFYYGNCPPDQTAFASFDVAWGDLTATLVYAGSWFAYQIDMCLGTDVVLVPDMSIGGYSNIGWGQNPPYTGLVVSDVIAGCGQGYVSGATWGCPRWSLNQCLFGAAYDLAYCIGTCQPSATEASTWGKVRSLYR